MSKKRGANIGANMPHKSVENDVLSVYKKVSPSYRGLENGDNFDKYYMRRKNILNELCLTEQLFKEKNIIDIGGGSGDNSLFYALWGGHVTNLDPNNISCKKANELFEKFGKKLTSINSSLFDCEIKGLKNYDIVMCEGVLQHTYDPIKGLERIL